MDVTSGTDSTRRPVDWRTAGRVAGRLAPPGPVVGRPELVALVASLRAAADAAAAHVQPITGLGPAGGPGSLALVQVVDRTGWATANARLLDTMMGAVPGVQPSSAVARAAGAVQVGGALALLAGKVLGQFDPFTADVAAPHGRLLVVAPNVLQVERALGVDPADFRLWVALHEQTHALQFAAAPWLAGHLLTRSAALMGDLAGLVPGVRAEPADEPVAGGPSLADVLRVGARLLRDGDDDGPPPDLLELLTAHQRELFDEVGAVMALLEGHADVTMDDVGPDVVPSVRHIRTRFEARRDAGARSRGPQRVLRRLLGLDTKLAQYRDGAAFVRTVRGAVGTEGLNRAFAGPDQLPTAREIADPRAWVRRVHG